MTQRKKSDVVDKFIIRLPDGLRGRIAVAAHQHRRSMNAEVVEALEKAFPEIPGWEEFQSDLAVIMTAYKANDVSWSREDMRSMLATFARQIAHNQPSDSEIDEVEKFTGKSSDD